MGSWLGYVFWLFYDVIILSHAPIFLLEDFFYFKLEYESLGTLFEFLAFLVQKLCQKNFKHFRISQGHLGDFPY